MSQDYRPSSDGYSQNGMIQIFTDGELVNQEILNRPLKVVADNVHYLNVNRIGTDTLEGDYRNVIEALNALIGEGGNVMNLGTKYTSWRIGLGESLVNEGKGWPVVVDPTDESTAIPHFRLNNLMPDLSKNTGRAIAHIRWGFKYLQGVTIAGSRNRIKIVPTEETLQDNFDTAYTMNGMTISSNALAGLYLYSNSFNNGMGKNDVNRYKIISNTASTGADFELSLQGTPFSDSSSTFDSDNSAKRLWIQSATHGVRVRAQYLDAGGNIIPTLTEFTDLFNNEIKAEMEAFIPIRLGNRVKMKIVALGATGRHITTEYADLVPVTGGTNLIYDPDPNTNAGDENHQPPVDLGLPSSYGEWKLPQIVSATAGLESMTLTDNGGGAVSFVVSGGIFAASFSDSDPNKQFHEIEIAIQNNYLDNVAKANVFDNPAFLVRLPYNPDSDIHQGTVSVPAGIAKVAAGVRCLQNGKSVTGEDNAAIVMGTTMISKRVEPTNSSVIARIPFDIRVFKLKLSHSYTRSVYTAAGSDARTDQFIITTGTSFDYNSGLNLHWHPNADNDVSGGFIYPTFPEIDEFMFYVKKRAAEGNPCIITDTSGLNEWEVWNCRYDFLRGAQFAGVSTAASWNVADLSESYAYKGTDSGFDVVLDIRDVAVDGGGADLVASVTAASNQELEVLMNTTKRGRRVGVVPNLSTDMAVSSLNVEISRAIFAESYNTVAVPSYVRIFQGSGYTDASHQSSADNIAISKEGLSYQDADLVISAGAGERNIIVDAYDKSSPNAGGFNGNVGSITGTVSINGGPWNGFVSGA